MSIFDDIPDEYQTHLPKASESALEEAWETTKREGKKALVDPFLEVGGRIKKSLQKVYEVASQPLGAEEPIYPPRWEEHPFEWAGALAGYIASIPIKVLGEIAESGEKALKGAYLLRGGPRGELGEWTPEQTEIASAALNLTLGAMVGGAPGGGGGVANIGRKDALAMLAKEFREMKKLPPEAVMFPNLQDFIPNMAKKVKPIAPTPFPRITISEKSYRTVTKGMKNIPQSVLDMAKEVGLAPPERIDITGRFRPAQKRVEFQVTKHLPPETIPHEFLHSVQMKKIGHKRVGGVPSAVLEAHAYEFERMFMKAVEELPVGKRIDSATFNRLYKESLGAMTEKYGTDLSKYKMGEVVRKAHLGRKWRRAEAEFESMAKEFPGWELKSEAPSKVGEIVELPQGKARFDGIQEGFGTIPQTYQYTFKEGLAKGSSFSSRTQKPADVAAAAQKITNLWAKYAGGKGGS